MKALCEHSESQNASLRLNALWALKHYVYAASFKIKKECLEELHSGWLVKLICDDTEDEALFSARARPEKMAGMDGMVDADEGMDLDDHTRSTMSSSMASRRSEDSRILRLAETKLAALREAELNPVRKARQDDLDIQEQGLDPSADLGLTDLLKNLREAKDREDEESFMAILAVLCAELN